MRVFASGGELGLGFVIAQRLLAAGHKITMLTESEDLVPNLTKNRMNSVVGDIREEAPQNQLAKADAVIDAQLPLTFPRKKIRIAHFRPCLLKQALKGSGRVLIVTSSAAVLGDTGPLRLFESARDLIPFAVFPGLLGWKTNS